MEEVTAGAGGRRVRRWQGGGQDTSGRCEGAARQDRAADAGE